MVAYSKDEALTKLFFDYILVLMKLFFALT